MSPTEETRTAVAEANAAANRWLKRLALVLAGLALALNATTAAIVYFVAVDARAAAVGAQDQAEAAKSQSAYNADLLGIVAAVTGCGIETPVGQCQTALAEAGARRLAEADCQTRRALASLPAPAPGVACIEQTPPSVYPGA
jgi:hypothetical protein